MLAQGGSGGDEVEVDPGISGQPVPDFFVLVRGVVVEDDVDFEIGIDAAFDGLDELQELLMPVPGHAFMDDMACGDVEGCEQGGGAVPLVVVRHGAGSALLEREAGLGAVQSLDLALLVEGEDHGVVRRVHIDAHHVVEFLDQAGIARELEAADLMRLESVFAPDPPDGHMVDPQGLAHQPTGPVRRFLGRRIFARGLLDDLLLHLAGVVSLRLCKRG